MPKKFAPRRRYARKPSMAKAKKMVTKQRKVKAKKNMDTFFLKTKNLYNITPVQGVSVSNYIYSVATMDPTGTAAAFTTNAEFNLYKLQYDKFRVNSITVRVKPKANMLDQALAQNDTGLTLTGDGLVHTCIDRDGAAPSSIAIISRYPSYKSYSVLKPFSRTYSVRYPTGIWLDCQAVGSFSMAKELGLTGSITMYLENLLEDSGEIFNEPWAEVTVETNIVFQGKTSNSLTGVYDDLGNLVGVTINALQAADIKAVTPLVNIRGTLDLDTRTRNDTTEDSITDKD